MRFSILKKNYLIIFVIIIIIIFSIFLLELLLRFYGLGSPIVYENNMSYKYAPIRNQSVKRLKNSTITINEKGLRSRTSWDNTNNNKIIFFGDSVTYGGSYIDDKDIFSELTCEILNNKNSKYLCGNAGVNAYGADNIKNRILYKDIKNEQWIIVTLIVDNGYRSLSNIAAIPAFLEKPKIFPAIQEIIMHISWKFNNFLRGSSLKSNKDLFFFKKSFDDLKTVLIKESNQHKRILVILHPSKEQILKGIVSEDYLIVKKIFEENESKLIFLDIYDLIKLSNSYDLYYDDIHLNKKGHKFFAEKISNIINQYDNY